MFDRLLCVLLALVLVFCGVPACGAEETPVMVVCSFYPIRVFAENVLQGVPGVTLSTLAPAGTGCLHDFQLMTGDLKKLEGAACLIINGAGMEQNFLPLLTREHGNLPLVDCSADIPLLQDEEGDNPHIWLSPRLASRMVRNMAQGLAEVLPAHQELIIQNAEAYAGKLEALGARMREALLPWQGRNIVTFHEAFPYFAEDMGLHVLAAVTVEPDESPSPRLIAETVELIRKNGVCPLFSEPGVQQEALNAIARETGVPVFELDPITDGEIVPDAYETAMEKNLLVLESAFRQ